MLCSPPDMMAAGSIVLDIDGYDEGFEAIVPQS